MKTTTTVHWNVGKIARAHNRREAELVEHEEHIDNGNKYGDSFCEVLVDRDLMEVYSEIFYDAIESFNAKQKRRDRMKSVESYMVEVENDDRGKRQTKKVNGKAVVNEESDRQGKQLEYEVTVKVGNTEREKDIRGRVLYDSTGHHIRAEYLPRDLQRTIAKKYCATFQEANPNFIVTSMTIHGDEGWINKKGEWEYDVIHPHITFVPIATGFKQGLSVQNSMNKALAQMGCGGPNGYDLWAKKEQERLEIITLELYNEYCLTHPDFSKTHGKLEFYHPVNTKTREGGKCKEVYAKEQELAEDKAEYIEKMNLFRTVFRKYCNEKKEWEKSVIDTEIELNQLRYNMESVSFVCDEKMREIENIEEDTVKRNQEAVERLKTANTGSEKVMGAFIRERGLNKEFALFCEDFFEIPIMQKQKSYGFNL